MRASLAWRWAFLCFAAVLLAARPAEALDVERWDWGFDGHVVPMVFNLLTVEVANNSPTAFEGKIALQEGNGIVRSDLPLVEEGLYIEPYGKRRLQFFPFINESWTEFTLIWGDKPEERLAVAGAANPLRNGPRATVLIRDAATSLQVRSKLPTFDEGDFPISVAGMDGLKGVVLDHVPRWDGLRMQAFREWIGAGGQVHLLKGVNGEYPKFPAPLEGLNDPSDAVSIGNGRVFHHAISVGEISDQFVGQTLGIKRQQEDLSNRGYSNDYQYQPSNSIAPLLRDLTRPDHNWGLIYFLSFIYLLVVFPGCWLLGRRRADFRISYPALLAAVFLFSLAFKTVGQRGYGEETAWNAVGTAKRVAPGRFLTETWSNAFVTSGKMYEFKHKGDGLIYSSGGSNDTRRGECVNRPASKIVTEIPPFSSQTILHTSVVTAPDFNVELTRADLAGPVIELELALTGQVPQIFSLHGVYGSQLVNLTRDGNVVRSSGTLPLLNFVQNSNYGYSPYRNYNSPRDPATIYLSAEQPLIARSLRLMDDTRSNNDNLQAPAGVVRVYLYAETPAEFLEIDGGPAKRQGRTLYVFDFPVDQGRDE